MNPIYSKFFEDLFSVLVVAQYNSVVSINISSSILGQISAISLLPLFAAVSSSWGTDTNFRGATRDFDITILQKISLFSHIV